MENNNFYGKMNLINEKYDQLKLNDLEKKFKSFWLQIILSLSFLGAFIFFLLLFLIGQLTNLGGLAGFSLIVAGLCFWTFFVNSFVLSIRILANDYGHTKIEKMKKLWGLLSLLWLPAPLYQIIFVIKGKRYLKFYKSNSEAQINL